MELVVFYKLNGYLLWINPESSESMKEKKFFKAIDDELYIEGRTYSGEVLLDRFSANFSKSFKYTYRQTKKYIVFYNKRNLIAKILRAGRYKKDWLTEAESLVNDFRHRQKEALLDGIVQANNIKEYLSCLSRYAFCEHFSLWSFDKYTSVFTCEASSFSEFDNEHIINGVPNGLIEVLGDDYPGYENRSLNGEYRKCDSLRALGIKSLCRIKLIVGEKEKTTAVVNFYSKRSDFCLPAVVVERLKSLVESKYVERIHMAEEQIYEFSNSTVPNIDTVGIDDYLTNFARNICMKLRYEACSIFTLEGGSLLLKATSDYEKDIPPENVTYELDGSSLTSKVFMEDDIICCYDLNNETANSHRYDEKTESEASNWVGIPIRSDIGVIGVLRVKNKYVLVSNNKKVRQPRPLDVINLLKASMILRMSLDIYKKYNDLNGKLKDQENFIRVLLHEIRTPISKFNMGPEIIKRSLERENIEYEKKRKLLNQLSDIQVMAGRLKMITDAYNFREIVKLKKFETFPLLAAVIYPVLTITKPYLEKQHDCFIDLDVTAMNSCWIFGDQDLYAMALNALLDNAAKYCNGKDKRIRVYANYHYGDEFVYLSIRNRGFPISSAERKKIFYEGYRADSVIREKIHGTGIGLFLAKTIMNESGGDLRLKCYDDPEDIEFILKIPAANVNGVDEL